MNQVKIVKQASDEIILEVSSDIKRIKLLNTLGIIDGNKVIVRNSKITSIDLELDGKIESIKLNKVSPLKKVVDKTNFIFRYTWKGIKNLWDETHFKLTPKDIKEYYQRFKKRVNQKGELFYNPFNRKDYNDWLEKRDNSVDKVVSEDILFSVVMPVYNVDSNLLSAAIESVLKQSYQNFELCIIDDASTKKETLDCLKKYEANPKVKIGYHQQNKHISITTNDAIDLASGDFIVFMDNDDLLAPDALMENAIVLKKESTLDIIYSDEDKIDLKGRYCMPHFKPDFSYDTLVGVNYICHLCVMRKSLIDQIGGLREGYEGVQDHDLLLRAVEKTNKIYHIPKILYHWRMLEGSTALSVDQKAYASDKGTIMLENMLKRRGLTGKINKINNQTLYLVDYDYPKSNPKISIIIPAKDHVELTKQAVKSIVEHTNYPNFEIVIADNNSIEKETKEEYVKLTKKYSCVRIEEYPIPFNFPRINNEVIAKTDSEYVVLMNNDVEVISDNWLEKMLGYAALEHIGAVGCKLLYPDNTIQHAGIYVGVAGVASHNNYHKSKEDLGVYGRLVIPYNYSCVTAACLMIKKEKYLAVNGMDENLAVAYNDVDLCLKLIDEGYFNICLPQVEMYHYESKSRGEEVGEKYNRFIKEANYMYDKWPQYINNDPFYNPNYSKKYCEVLDMEKRG